MHWKKSGRTRSGLLFSTRSWTRVVVAAAIDVARLQSNKFSLLAIDNFAPAAAAIPRLLLWCDGTGLLAQQAKKGGH